MSDYADRLEVLPVPKGSGIEPEEAPAKRIQSVPLTVNLSNGLPTVTRQDNGKTETVTDSDYHARSAIAFPRQTPVLRVLAPVSSEMPAGEVAKLMRQRCARCVHFRNDEWKKTKQIWENAPLGSSRKIGLAKMIIQLARSVLDRTPEVRDLQRASHDLGFWGTCVALTEERADMVIVHPEACCPDGVNYYQDRGENEKREASKVYDGIMRAAQGQRP